MNKLLPAIAMAALLAAGARAETTGDRWIHVRVDDNDEGSARVDIQVPIGMVSGLLPMLRDKTGSGEIHIDGAEMDVKELRGYWNAVRNAKDGEYVTVRDDDAHVRIAKNGGVLLVNVDERKDGGRIRMKLPVPLVDAALAGSDSIDVEALVRALGKAPSGDLVTVDDDDTHVRIWIDAAPASPREDVP